MRIIGKYSRLLSLIVKLRISIPSNTLRSTRLDLNRLTGWCNVLCSDINTLMLSDVVKWSENQIDMFRLQMMYHNIRNMAENALMFEHEAFLC